MDQLFDDRRYLIPFRSSLLPQIFCDTLVIGAGVAGLRAAVEAAGDSGDGRAAAGGGSVGGHDVIVLSKGPFNATNTSWAQGGIAAVRGGPTDLLDSGDVDTVESHVSDTLTAGAGLCDEHAVRVNIAEGTARFEELLRWGARFDGTSGDGGDLASLSAGREGGHSASRIFHAGGDTTGREVQRVLAERAAAHPFIRIFESCFALDLITPSAEPGAPVLGAITHHPRYGLQMIWAKTTILAAGGAGQVYRETTNPRPATADGLALAYRAGASLADMAFVQFHPTTLYLPGAARSLISEAVRGEGAVLLDAAEQPFMRGVHPMADLAPRDVVSAAITRQIAEQGGKHVWLDCRGITGFEARFPSIHETLTRFELDPLTDLIPVHPACHYMIGGVRTDLDARTGVPGLLAAGEVAATGLHGANRLASNSLLEGLVMGARAGATAASRAGAARAHASDVSEEGPRPVPIVSDIRPSDQGELDLHDVRSSLRSAMWKNVGIERAGPKLADAGRMFDFWARYTLDKVFDEAPGWETQNMLLVAALIARSAAWREESRGCHRRGDFTMAENRLAVHDLWRRGVGEPEIVGRDELAGVESAVEPKPGGVAAGV